MAIERVTAPYEILLRFNFDPAFGPLGIFRGAHYIEGEALVDTESDAVLSYTPGPALPLADADAVEAYFGAQFPQVEAAYSAALAANSALAQEVVRLAAELAAVTAERDAMLVAQT